jgi:hypothetical protein
MIIACSTCDTVLYEITVNVDPDHINPNIHNCPNCSVEDYITGER